MVLNINSAAVVRHAATLIRLSENALPIAVRQTLNSAAYDVKVKTMPQQVAKTFEKREPNFFRANSRVEAAKGANIATMAAIVGFMNIKPMPVREKDLAVQDLEQQEQGGNIEGRTFIPIKGARVSGSHIRKVKAKFRLKEINNEIFDSQNPNVKGKNGKENFTLSAITAGAGGFVLGNKLNSKGNRILYHINSVKRMKRTYTNKVGRKYRSGNTVINTTAIYSMNKGRKARVKGTNFMRKSSLLSASKMEQNFILEAKKQILKRL